MGHIELFHGIVVAIEEIIKSKNYSFVLERLVTLQDEEENKKMFLLTDETELLQGSYFELGDMLEIWFDMDSSYPCYLPPRFVATMMKVKKNEE